MKNVILSNKLTFSLTSLIVLLVFYAPSAMADHGDFGVSISAAETMVDVSSADGMQIASGRDRASRDLATDTARFITLLLKSDRIVSLAGPDTGVTDPDLDDRGVADTVLDITDIVIDAYDGKGRALGVLANTAETDDVVILSHRDPTNPGREFLIRIDETELTNAYTAARAGGAAFEIHTLLFSIPAKKMEQADIGYVTARRHPDGHTQHFNKAVAAFRVDLVDDDEGEARYNVGTSSASVGDLGIPGVVAIQQLRERTGFIESGSYQVRVILTEEPKGGLTKDLVMVTNGSATAVRKGATIQGAYTAPATVPSALTLEMAGYTTMAGTPAATAATDLPEATGRDNMYHQYFVTIMPTPGFDGTNVISIKQFSDQVLPVGNMYVPLADQQIVATTLPAAEVTVRNARVANETLTVRVHTIEDEKIAAAKAGYDARQKIYDANPLVKVLGNKLIVPAGGYLVLAKGKTDSDPVSGVVNVSMKTKDKKTDAQKMYNVVYDFGLPFPADDLSNYFLNGGELNLAYQDIPAATDSGHGDAKGPTGDDATGYTAASTNAYAAGALIINEIMWGLDANSPNSQYIELYNPGTTAVGLDNKEWVISVGDAPTGFTVIDTVNNVPASGYWPVPGSSGVSKIEPNAGFFALVDIVSMSRVMDTADGTDAASWAESMRPSGNITGRRIGTPGAKNSYVMPVVPPPPPAAPATDVATAEDIMISEVMVPSNEGRLPQWIELANVSGKEVSLSGWSVDIDNDSDASSSSYRVDIGDVTVGKDQTLLIISKAGRNSGTGMGADAKGTLREDRIVDVQSQVSPGEANYMLISEIAFKLSLVLPPGTGTVKTGDVVGNLGMAWELPAFEGTGRSSLIRREMGETTELMGTDAAGWVLASETGLSGAYVGTFYGDKDDIGTPGYDAGGALPVELSKFSAARDRVTGQVVIAWETQSELNNAGFFIKRSQQRNGQFMVVNPAMIQGAGTTSEKQSYTYTDTTAKPNIVYYYQIEDVSLDGNRQTLTRGHRLKGHIGAAGKATTTWGDLKTSLDQ